MFVSPRSQPEVSAACIDNALAVAVLTRRVLSHRLDVVLDFTLARRKHFGYRIGDVGGG
jgi:hypothetical protein